MTMTDPIADFLTRLRNANTAFHDEVKLPSSKIKVNIAEILKREATSPTTAPKTPRSARPSSSTSSTGLPVSAALPACAACRSPAFACTRSPPTCQGPGRTRRGDHLHVLRSAHRSPGGQAEGRRGSPRLRLVREATTMSRIGKLPVAVPSGVEVNIDGQNVAVKGPKATWR